MPGTSNVFSTRATVASISATAGAGAGACASMAGTARNRHSTNSVIRRARLDFVVVVVMLVILAVRVLPLQCAMLADLGLVAAQLHRAPPSGLVLADIQKQPAARLHRALVDIADVARGQQLGGGSGDGPGDAIEDADPVRSARDPV